MSLRNPVKYPVKYYSWQDDQAPQLSNVDGVIKTILKACLVNGYGSKAGAGWTALFEDAYRIVLRRPLRTGNPPDIKIENGTTTGTTVRHRIVAQDNPTGLDDATELSSVALHARGVNGQEWHCFVTDFAFVLCYQIGFSSAAENKRNDILFVGSAIKSQSVDLDYFFMSNDATVSVSTGIPSSWPMPLFHSNYGFYDARRKINYISKPILNLTLPEKTFDNDYCAQKILIDTVASLPFYCALSENYDDNTTKIVSISNRNMLRYVNQTSTTYKGFNARAFYIPLDYWEL